MEERILKSILFQLEEINKNIKEQNTVKTLGYKEVSEIMHINNTQSSRFLKTFGYKYGHLAIEQSKLKEILNSRSGDLNKL